jgi:hypothetical protein
MARVVIYMGILLHGPGDCLLSGHSLHHCLCLGRASSVSFFAVQVNKCLDLVALGPAGPITKAPGTEVTWIIHEHDIRHRCPLPCTRL